MATQEQKKPETIEKTHTHVEVGAEVPEITSGPPIFITYNGQKYNLMGGDLDIDPLTSGDRAIIKSVEKALGEQIGEEILLREHQIIRLDNGNWVISPPAVYGA